MKRISTMIPSLDKILHGGFPSASINIITGSPGTGKTVLVQQMAYGNAGPANKVMYLTTLNEPMHKVLRYVQGFPFFDAEKVGDSVVYEDLGEVFQGHDVEAVLRRIEELVMTESPTILIIDSFKALSDMAPEPATFRRALYGLTGALTASGCTTFLLGEYDTADVGVLPEFAIADGILELTNDRKGIRTHRHLSVVKLRGSDYEDGSHALRITSTGVSVFPRFRTPAQPETYEPSEELLTTGVPALDEILHGGLRRGSTTFVGGATGTGKTLLALTFTLAHAERGGPIVLASFQEDPNQLRRLAKRYGGDFAASEEADHLRLVYVSPVELDMDEHVLRIVGAIEEVGAKCLVIDSFSDLEEGAYDRERFLNFAFSLIQYLKDRQITALATYEVEPDAPPGAETAHDLSRIADNVILLRDEREGRDVIRELRVVKTRGSGHDHDVHVMRFTDDGIVLDERAERRGG